VINEQATNDAVATGLLAGLVVFLGVLVGLSAAHAH
jgi:hypothetical protein